MTPREAAEQQIEEDRRALARARAELRRIDEALRESRRVRREALPKLKRAGLVR